MPRLHLPLTLALLLVLLPAAPAAGADAIGGLLREALAAAPLAPADDADALLRALYAARAERPLWLTRSGRPTRQAVALIEQFDHADRLGLDGDAYEAGQWPQRQAALATAEPAAQVAFELALSRTALRLVQHLQHGRVDPRRLGLDLDRGAADPLHPLQALAVSDDTAAVLAALEPPFPGYLRLRRALPGYVDLARRADTIALPPLPARVLEPGMTYAGTALLADRLRQLGDLADADATAEPPAAYDGAVVAAIERFQQRHGLQADGRIGPLTWAALSTPLSHRVDQIRLALERWRWAPREFARPPIVVNIPEFRLRAIGDDGRVGFETEVVVGRSFRRQTPVFAELLRSVVFQPSWHVPTSIVRRDLVPKAERDPGYLARHGYRIVGRDDQTVTAGVLEELRGGRLGLRQLPGPDNSLGAVKFLFPNDHSVYLHDTPATALFAHARRDFSSGCVRLRDPGGLAEWVLRNQPDWPPQRIRAALAGGPDDLTVAVVPPIPVFLVYVTAVAPESGGLHFFADIYGHDATLLRVLQER